MTDPVIVSLLVSLAALVVALGLGLRALFSPENGADLTVRKESK